MSLILHQMNLSDLVLNDIYTGKKNKNMVEKFKPMVRKAFSAFINDICKQKLKRFLVPCKMKQKIRKNRGMKSQYLKL